MRRWLILLLLTVKSQAEEWDANNYPNPTAGQFKECNMKTTANICDPDEVLSVQARYRLDHDLKQLESRTRQDHARTFCDKKGVTAAMAVARHVKGGTTEAVKAMANDMLRKWTLDQQCQKSVVFVVSTDDRKFWVARDDKVPVYGDEFNEIFLQQKSLFQQNNYQQALTNIMQQTWERALSKQGSPRPRPDGGPHGGQPGPQPGFGGGPNTMGDGSKGSGFKMPSIPGWFWVALFLLIIPLICFCLCCYCCCCRGKRSAAAGATTHDGGGGMSGGASRGGGGGGGSMFRNIATSAGGAGIGSMLGNLISGRGGRSMGGGGMGMGGGGMGMGGGGYQGGGAYPATPAPVYDDNAGQGGGGLYPSKAIKDEGGGGSWA